jgi:hypothetical protein
MNTTSYIFEGQGQVGQKFTAQFTEAKTEREVALACELAKAIGALDNQASVHAQAMHKIKRQLEETKLALAVEKKANEFLTAQWTNVLEHLAEIDAREERRRQDAPVSEEENRAHVEALGPIPFTGRK